MIDYYCKLQPGGFYHVFNQGNNKENLFYTKANYEYFLRQYDYYLSPYVDTFAFCLLGNHFHLLIAVKSEQEILNLSLLREVKDLKNTEVKDLKIEPHELVAKQFQAFFTGYAKAINLQTKRTGSLFRKRFKRVEVDSTRYLANLVYYIHANPQRHGIYPDFRDYSWSSYDRIMRNKPTKLQKQAVLEWFNDKQNYVDYHASVPDLDNIRHLMIE